MFDLAVLNQMQARWGFVSLAGSEPANIHFSLFKEQFILIIYVSLCADWLPSCLRKWCWRRWAMQCSLWKEGGHPVCGKILVENWKHKKITTEWVSLTKLCFTITLKLSAKQYIWKANTGNTWRAKASIKMFYSIWWPYNDPAAQVYF